MGGKDEILDIKVDDIKTWRPPSTAKAWPSHTR
jgi:hypothetical protein